VSLALVLGVGEIVVRARLGRARLAALPHAGLDVEADHRLRWFERDHDRPWPLIVAHPLLGWRNRPDARLERGEGVVVTTNEDGLRGRARVARPKPAGAVRVGVFGCSQTFAAGVGDDETYSARLGAALPAVEVLNFGVDGYGTDQMLLLHEAEAARYDLDVVVLAFAYYHIGRNVLAFRSYAKPRFELAPDGALHLTGVPVPAPEALLREGAPPRPLPLADRSLLLRWAWSRLGQARERRMYRPDSPAWALTRALIARFAAGAGRAGSRMVLMNVEEDGPEIEPALGDLARELGIDFLNLGPVLGAVRGRGVRLRLPRNPHWNASGHRLIARELRTFLCARQAVPCDASSARAGLAGKVSERSAPRSRRGPGR
jgi:hypothetical protein